MSKAKSDSKPTKRTNVSQLKAGDFLSETQYYKVVEVRDDKVDLVNERGFKLSVSHGIIEEAMYSASQFDSTVNVTRTELCGILENAGDSIFTVNFNKQLKEKDVVEEILEAVEGAGDDAKTLTKKVKAAVKKGVKGEVRTLIGYLIETEAKMGRSKVIDLEAPPKRRYRLVDHRTINWLVLKNVKYMTKSK